MSLSFLKRTDRPALAYKFDLAQNPSASRIKMPVIVFLSGFRSDMEGSKAAFLARMCGDRGYDFLRFDYSGHGNSEGSFEDGTIGRWTEDALAMIDMTAQKANGRPLILIGSSMGGWIGLLCALQRPERIKAFIGLAAAPDFTRDIKADMDFLQKEMLEKEGYFLAPDGNDGFFKVTSGFIEDGIAHGLLDGPITLNCPVRLVHGVLDRDVPLKTAERLYECLSGEDKKLYLQPDSGHRLSSPDDLSLLESIVVEIMGE